MWAMADPAGVISMYYDRALQLEPTRTETLQTAHAHMHHVGPRATRSSFVRPGPFYRCDSAPAPRETHPLPICLSSVVARRTVR